MKTEIETLRETIQTLEADERRTGSNREKLKRAGQRLAYLTGTIFVAIRYINGDVNVFGVVEGTRTNADGMFLVLNPGNIVTIVTYLTAETITLRLAPGGQISFNITNIDNEERSSYDVVSFTDRDAAEAWATERRVEHASR